MRRTDLISCVVFINSAAKINMRHKFDQSLGISYVVYLKEKETIPPLSEVCCSEKHMLIRDSAFKIPFLIVSCYTLKM